jgi:hypothetical protein
MRAILCLAFILTVLCSCGPDGDHKFSQPLPKNLINEINQRVYEVEQSIAECDLLAKCLGYKKGEVKNDTGEIHYYVDAGTGMTHTYTIDQIDFHCVMGKKTVPFQNISLLYEGCTEKKCGKECPAEGFSTGQTTQKAADVISVQQ